MSSNPEPDFLDALYNRVINNIKRQIAESQAAKLESESSATLPQATSPGSQAAPSQPQENPSTSQTSSTAHQTTHSTPPKSQSPQPVSPATCHQSVAPSPIDSIIHTIKSESNKRPIQSLIPSTAGELMDLSKNQRKRVRKRMRHARKAAQKHTDMPQTIDTLSFDDLLEIHQKNDASVLSDIAPFDAAFSEPEPVARHEQQTTSASEHDTASALSTPESSRSLFFSKDTERSVSPFNQGQKSVTVASELGISHDPFTSTQDTKQSVSSCRYDPQHQATSLACGLGITPLKPLQDPEQSQSSPQHVRRSMSFDQDTDQVIFADQSISSIEDVERSRSSSGDVKRSLSFDESVEQSLHSSQGDDQSESSGQDAKGSMSLDDEQSISRIVSSVEPSPKAPVVDSNVSSLSNRQEADHNAHQPESVKSTSTLKRKTPEGEQLNHAEQPSTFKNEFQAEKKSKKKQKKKATSNQPNQTNKPIETRTSVKRSAPGAGSTESQSILDVAYQILGQENPQKKQKNTNQGNKMPVQKKFVPKVDCVHFARGFCKMGDECTFKHDPEAARAAQTVVTAKNPTSDIVCQFFKTGSCGKGEDCSFSHDLGKEPCRFFHMEGTCKNSGCPYSHAPLTQDLMERLRRLTGPCRFYFFKGYCESGHGCKFSHDEEQFSEEDRLKVSQEILPCKFYHLHKSCKNGDSCFYLHDEASPEQIKALKKE